MSKAFFRWAAQKLVSEGSRTPIMEQAARRAVEVEQRATKEFNVWTSAAFSEVSRDVMSALGASADNGSQDAAQKPKRNRRRSPRKQIEDPAKTSDGAGGSSSSKRPPAF